MGWRFRIQGGNGHSRKRCNSHGWYLKKYKKLNSYSISQFSFKVGFWVLLFRVFCFSFESQSDSVVVYLKLTSDLAPKVGSAGMVRQLTAEHLDGEIKAHALVN